MSISDYIRSELILWKVYLIELLAPELSVLIGKKSVALCHSVIVIPASSKKLSVHL